MPLTKAKMARRRKSSDAGLGYLVLVGLLLAALGWLIDFVKANQDAVLSIIFVFVVIGAIAFVNNRVQLGRRRRAAAEEHQRAIQAEQARTEARRQYLLSRYNDEQIVGQIMERKVWLGMSREQLVESWGHPHDIKETLLKTKRKEEFKYTNVGVNRYLSRVFLEDGVVIGWKQ